VARLICDISMSLDGYIAGPNQTLEQPLGEGGERLHDWTVGVKSWRERHGMSGGETGPDDDVVKESLAAKGAVLMGRRMFSGGEGPWADDAKADGWWGDDPPFRVPVFIVTHHAREPVSKDNGTSYTFVTDGFEAAVEQARDAAGDNDVEVAGGATVVQQSLRAGLLDELEIHLVPVLLGGGVRLLDELEPTELELERVVASPTVTHLRYRRA
jgi:dihydrofolate reductase